MKYIVQIVPAGQTTAIERSIDIPACSNSAGELVVTVSRNDIYSVGVHITNLPAELRAKIQETELTLRARADMPGVLAGDVTPKGKRSKQPGGIKVEGRPEYQELYDALLAAKQLIADTQAQMLEASQPAPVIIPDGMVKITFVRSKADGWISVYRDEQGNEFDSPQIAGSERGTAWMTPEAHADALTKIQAAATEAADKETRRLKQIVQRGEELQAQGMLLTYDEQRRKARAYDNAYNEGGDGYNPYRDIISLEEYNAAKSVLPVTPDADIIRELTAMVETVRAALPNGIDAETETHLSNVIHGRGNVRFFSADDRRTAVASTLAELQDGA